MPKRAFTAEQFIHAVASNFTIAAICRELGLRPAGGNYKTIHALTLQHELDTSHWLGQAHHRGQRKPTPSTHVTRANLESVLIENSFPIKSTRLKILLLQAGYFTYRCILCDIFDWQDRPLVLHLDHINGNNRDNRRENLRLLCPNCHSQTETYTGRNIKHCASETCEERKNRLQLRRMTPCPHCSGMKIYGAKQCRSCHNQRTGRTKIAWPPVSELKVELKTSSYLAVSRRLGISDNAIRKHLKAHS